MNDVQAAALFQQNPGAFPEEFRQGTIKTKAGVSVPMGPNGRRIHPKTFHAAATKALPQLTSALGSPESPGSAEEDPFQTPRERGMTPGLKHAVDEMATVMKRKTGITVQGAIDNLQESAQQVKTNPRSMPPDPANFEAHVDAVTRNDLQNMHASARDDDDQEAVRAVFRAYAELPQGVPTGAEEVLRGTTVLGNSAGIVTPGQNLLPLGSAPAGNLSPQQLEYGAADIPRTASAAEQEAADRSPSLTQPSAMNHSVEHSTVVTNAALLSLTEQMEQMAIDSQTRIDMHEDQLAVLGTLNTAVMEVNDNLKGKSNLLSNNSNIAQVQARTIERLGESNPKTAKLFERGLISLDQMRDRKFVEAMEQSLTLREQREGTLKSSSARQSSGPTEYTRTVERSKGVYQYRRPHFSTSPYFAE